MIDLSAACTVPAERTVVATGLFDGLHIGHTAVIDRALSLCKCGLAPAVFTFRTGTLSEKKSDIIISDEKKRELLSRSGVKYIYSPTFSSVREMSAERFVSEIIASRLNAARVVCGENFHFGKGGIADCDTLERICASLGIEVFVVPMVKMGARSVSSTRIRECLKDGRISEANSLLGREYSIDEVVISGNKIGRTLNFPTINQRIDSSYTELKRGVYTSIVTIGMAHYRAITNIGVKPTVSDKGELLAETHIIGFSEDIYGERIEVRLCDFLRNEKKFSSVEELKEQVSKDIKRSMEMKRDNNTERKI